MSELSVVMYHYVRDLKNSRYPKIKGIDYHKFRMQIEQLSSQYHIVTVEQVIASYNEGYQLPEKAMLLTFDDGYIDHFSFAFPVLNEFRVQGSFYIPGMTFAEHKLLDVNKIHFILATADVNQLVKDIHKKMNYYRGREFDFPTNDELFNQYAVPNRFDVAEVIYAKRLLQTVLPEQLRHVISSELFEKYVGIEESKFAKELYMNREQIKCLKNCGMHIGLHGYDHYWLGNLTKEAMEKDLNTALDVMEEFVDKKSWVMNYPYGSYNTQTLDFLKDNGCQLGFTTEVKVADLEKCGRLTIPRMDTNDF